MITERNNVNESDQKLTLEVPIVANINFLLTISIHCQEIRLFMRINKMIT